MNSGMLIHSKTLTREEKKNIHDFLIRQETASIEQFPDWVERIYTNSQFSYFTGYENGQVKCFCVVQEKYFLKATVLFGPVVENEQWGVLAIKDIARHYKEKKFGILTIQPGDPILHIEELITPESFPYFVKYNQKVSWSTKVIELNNESIVPFSQHHKRAIRKAIKEGLYTERISQPEELEAFCKGYIRMYKHRRLEIDENETERLFNSMFDYFREDKGFFIVVKNGDKKIIGGLLIVYQNDTAFYYKGYADVDYRQYPVTHLAFSEAIHFAKEQGKKIFDLGGYNTYALPNDQVFKINQFKDGFNGVLINYPVAVEIRLNIFRFILVRVLLLIKFVLS